MLRMARSMARLSIPIMTSAMASSDARPCTMRSSSRCSVGRDVSAPISTPTLVPHTTIGKVTTQSLSGPPQMPAISGNGRSSADRPRR